MAKNCVEMILGQKKTGREVVGTILRLVPDNKEFKVTRIDEENETIEVTEVLPEDSEALPKVVIIGASNANVAHYVNNPNPKPVPDATLSTDAYGKSILTVGDTDINCGQLKVKKLLGGIKGKLLLLVEANANALDLMSYEVQTDTFETIKESFTVAEAETDLVNLGDVTLLSDVLITIQEEELEDGSKGTYKKVEYSTIYQVSDGGYLTPIGDMYEPEYDEEYDEEDVTNLLDGYLIDSCYITRQSDRADLVLSASRKVDDNGRLVALDTPLVILYRINRANVVCEYVGSYSVADKDAKVYLGGSNGSAPVITVVDSKRRQITTSRGTLVVDDAKVLAALNGYNTFDGVYTYMDPEGRTGARWYYSNKDYQEVSFTSVETDRGTIFELK